MTSPVHCPICQREFDPATTPAMPFCSQRCRHIDLGRWLSEEQRIPYDQNEEDHENEVDPPKKPN
jgi:endogenous inhibitor of DNA gyrase (YacG/DUF329 family)